MYRFPFILFLCALWILSPKAHGQCVVYQDKNGQVLTTCDFYNPAGKEGTASFSQETSLGSPFLTYPVWQEGKIRLDNHSQELTCELSYNLLSNEVMCRFAGDSTAKLVTPEVFTINGTEFVRQQNKLLGIDYRMYATVLYNGPTKLLMSLTTKVEPLKTQLGSDYRDLNIIGIYQTKTKYYIRKEDARPELITLTKSSVLPILYEQSEKMSAKLSTKQLTTDGVIEALHYYDSLMAADRASKLPLSTNPLFSRVLHGKILYPEYARSQGIYGRVYAGFEIDQQGNVKNIAILSPDNGGFRFDIVVKSALEKLPKLDPTLQGKYALPVAFTYTNTKQTTGPHVPVNYLSPDRLEGRTVLEEFVVSSTVSKSTIDSQEVWGYFK